MTRLFRPSCSLLVFACLVLAPALAQSQSVATGAPSALVTSIAQESGHHQAPASSRADTLGVIVYKATRNDDGSIAKVGPPLNPAEDHVFKSGEFILVSFTPTFESYVYFINRGPEGTRVIFPPDVRSIRSIMPDETRNAPLKFNDKVGREEIIVVVSRDRLTKLDDAIAKPDKMLDTHTSPPTETTGTAKENKNAGTSSGQEHKGGTRPGKDTRREKKPGRAFDKAGLIAANPRWGVLENISSSGSSRGVDFVQEEGNASVQVRPLRDEKGSYRFGPGQVGAFSISFEHR